MGVLERILETKRREIAQLKADAALLKADTAQPRGEPARYRPRPIDLRRRTADPLHLITEIKLRSPSAGELSRVLSIADRASAYERGGANMLSVLCDAEYFDGSYQHLTEAREACALPLLCKEFVLDEIQLERAVAHGADAVLLIARCLSPERLGELVAAARSRSLTPLVEVFTQDESAAALRAGADWIGVNARDLDTLVIDVELARSILDELPPHVTRVHLSGLKTPADVQSVSQTRVDAALIGETLMREDDPEPLLRALVAQAG